jgi:S-adenosylmethionine:tRNA ribosyltransferase-isomerase
VETSRFFFELPEELIAQQPAERRDGARLLVVNMRTGKTADSGVGELDRWIEPGTLLVLNDTRVRKARLFGEGPGGGKTEFLLLAEGEGGVWQALAGRSRRVKTGQSYLFAGGVRGVIAGSGEDTRLIRFDPPIDDEYLEAHGHVPLPPYIKRPDNQADSARYQTVFARTMGSAAAPTAGLHFTRGLLRTLESRGVETAYVTLHVGLGTFLPIRARNLEEHVMHEEAYRIPPRAKSRIELALKEARPVLAVGTTVVRALESAWDGTGLREGKGKTRIFISPGFRFKVVNALFTNFHTPGSTLLALVCAFAGTDLILRTYGEAVAKKYRFFSYGDAMLIK